MESIDLYIKKAQSKDGGYQATKAYPFVEDGVILVRKSEKDFEELKNRIKICKEKGINIPMYIDYKFDGKNYWILEELAPGQEFEYLVKNENVTKIFAEMPYEHIEKYIRDSYLLEVNGIGIEPRRRNIFYDKEVGFTTIDVALLNEYSESDSLKDVNYFFNMLSFVCLPPFSNDEYGEKVTEKTVLNIMRAFENGHPFFKKYRRWIYRGNSYFAEFLKKHGADLTLNEEETNMLIKYIDELIDSVVKDKIKNPETLFWNENTSYISLLNSSIEYCPNFNLFNLQEQTLEKYVNGSVYSKIKALFSNNIDDSNLRNLYFEIRRKELDSIGIYPTEYVYEKIEQEITNVNPKKM